LINEAGIHSGVNIEMGPALHHVFQEAGLPAPLMLLWVGCIAGALQDSEYISKLAVAGFDGIDIEPTRVYSIEDAGEFLSGRGVDVAAIAPQVEGKFMSAFIRATKPASCCAPGCCA
jgi:arsenite methyltransferase